MNLTFEIEAHGYGAILVLGDTKVDEKTAKLMVKMKDLTKQPLADLSSKWKPLPQKMVEIAKMKPAVKAPEGMILVPTVPKFQFKVCRWLDLVPA